MPKKLSPIKARIRKVKADLKLQFQRSWGGEVTRQKVSVAQFRDTFGSALDGFNIGYSVMELIKAGYPKEEIIEAFKVKQMLDKYRRIKIKEAIQKKP